MGEIIEEFNGELNEDPYVDVHCIGKSPSGEGIIFFFRNKNKIFYSGVIDACIDDTILKENKIKELNLICWTHPHKDHYEGLNLILDKYSGPNTKILIPMGVEATIHKQKDQEEKALFEKMATTNRNGTKSKGKVILGGINRNIENIIYLDKKNGVSMDLKIQAYAPVDSIISGQSYLTGVDYNDYSIILVLTVNEANFVFTGDASKTTINELIRQNIFIKNAIYVKIPHHGSKSSEKFIDLIKSKTTTGIGVTTIFKGNGYDQTPNKKVLKSYLDNNYKIYITNKSYFKRKKSKADIGIVSTRFQIPIDETIEECNWDNKCIGEADEIEKDENNILIDLDNRNN